MTDAEQDLSKPRRGGLWHHLDFRRLWIGETVSQFGSTISGLALPLVAILVVGATTFEVGLLTALETAAFLLVGLPAGAWVDRMRFRAVLIVNDVIRAAALGSVPLAYWLGILTIGQLYLVAVLTGVCTVFFDVAYQSYLPQLVDRKLLVEGNSKLQASESVSQIAGPSSGGLLIQALTAPYAVLVDALSFLWSAGWVAAIKLRPARPERKPDRHLRREIGEGLKFVVGNRSLRSIAMCTGSANLFGAMAGAVFYVLLARELGLSAGWIRADRVDLGDRWPARLSSGRQVCREGWSGPGHLDLGRHQRTLCFRGAVRTSRLVARALGVGSGCDVDERGRLQHHPGELSSGVVPTGAPWTDERDHAVPGVGHHAGRSADRRRARHDLQCSDHFARRGRRRNPRVSAGISVATATNARAPELPGLGGAKRRVKTAQRAARSTGPPDALCCAVLCFAALRFARPISQAYFAVATLQAISQATFPS